MRRFRAIAFVAAFCALASNAGAVVPAPTVLQVLGSVTASARPVSNALVIALNLNDFIATETLSALDGSFVLPPLQAGVYKIMAVKQGFAPAITTIVPTRGDHRVSLKLLNDQQAKGKSANQEMWELRGSLPPDILRDLDNVMSEAPQAVAANAPPNEPRFRGEMTSLTGVADQSANPAFAQTTLGVQSRIGDSWQLGFRGNLHRVEDTTDEKSFGTPLAQSSVMAMELRSSPTDSYRLASTKSWWRYRDDDPESASGAADVRSNNLEWEHGDTHVQVRYLAQQNLFAANPAGSDLIDIGGNTTVMQTGRSDLGVSLHVSQESYRNTSNLTSRIADVSANASLALVPSFVVRYGMSSRLELDGTEWAPRAGVEWKIAPDTAFVVSGLYKVFDQAHAQALPTIVLMSEEGRALPHYSYSFGIVSGTETGNRISAIATVSAVDSPLRVVFTDGFEQFWDGLDIDAGDLRRDVSVTCQRSLGRYVAINLSGSAGTATPSHALTQIGQKQYVTGNLESTFRPSGTSLAIVYREIEQPQPNHIDYKSERVNVHVAQSLHLPIDVKVLIGLEVARAENSPFLLDALEADGETRRYIGGVAINF